MKAMVLKAPGKLALEEVASPRPETGEVLVRVTNTGVCGTDLKIFSGAIPVAYPRLMGHEIAGEVVDPGNHASLRAGDRVIVDPELYCGSCFHCRIGQTHLCPSGMLLGRDKNGGFAELLTAPATHVFPLPDSIPSRSAPLIQVLTTCLHAQRQVSLFPGESAVVLGLGVTGQLHVQLAKARGASPVIGITRSPYKQDLARKLGADITLPGGPDVVAKVREATGGRGADLVIECTGVLSSLASAIEMARAGGRILMFGISTQTQASLPFYQLYFKELSLINARVAKSEDYPASIDLVQRGTVKLEPLITETLPYSELRAAIASLESDGGQRMKIILEHT